MSRDVSDVITVTADNAAGLGHDREFFIEGMNHRVSSGGRHDVTYLLGDAQETIAASGEGYIVVGTGKVGGKVHWTS